MAKEFLDGYWGVWRTIKGNEIFIREGESLEGAIERCNPKLFKALSSDELSEVARQEIETAPKYEEKSVGDLPFAGGILDKKEYVEEYSFTGSKFANEEADIYHLKDGAKFIFQSMGDEYYQKITPEQAIRVWNKLPNYLKRFSQEEIEFVDYYNPDDVYWQKVYVDFKHSFANSGTKITFYRNNDCSTTDAQLFYVFCHEIGHNFDRQLSQTTTYKNEWENIIKQDGGNRVSEYAKNHIQEDFADSVALYVEDPLKFKKDFPNRFNFMEKWLKGAIK